LRWSKISHESGGGRKWNKLENHGRKHYGRILCLWRMAL
jgi:hypothetical protein